MLGKVGEIYSRFNPRTYIRYDLGLNADRTIRRFQSTYLYKVRLSLQEEQYLAAEFQSTYLYKVRHGAAFSQFRQGSVSIHVPI